MPMLAKRLAPAYLREARLKAGHVSRSTASTKAPFSSETMGRHERGEVPLTPEDALVYAEVYQQPAILLRYCADCPVGQHLRPQPNDREFAWTALKMSNRLKKAEQYAKRLDEIADDNSVAAEERPDFNEILGFMASLESMATDLRLFALQEGIIGFDDMKKPPPLHREAAAEKNIPLAV